MPNDRGTRQRHSFATIAAAALSSVDSVLSRWLPGGKREGREYKARNPTRNDREVGSFSINTLSGKWGEFAHDGARGSAGNDLISLVAYLEGCKNGAAADKLADFLGLRSSEAPAAPARACGPGCARCNASRIPRCRSTNVSTSAAGSNPATMSAIILSGISERGLSEVTITRSASMAARAISGRLF